MSGEGEKFSEEFLIYPSLKAKLSEKAYFRLKYPRQRIKVPPTEYALGAVETKTRVSRIGPAPQFHTLVSNEGLSSYSGKTNFGLEIDKDLSTYCLH